MWQGQDEELVSVPLCVSQRTDQLGERGVAHERGRREPPQGQNELGPDETNLGVEVSRTEPDLRERRSAVAFARRTRAGEALRETREVEATVQVIRFEPSHGQPGSERLSRRASVGNSLLVAARTRGLADDHQPVTGVTKEDRIGYWDVARLHARGTGTDGPLRFRQRKRAFVV